MKTFKITATAKVEVVTLVRARNAKQAEKIAMDRGAEICIHGSELCEHEISHTDFVLVDGTPDEINIHSVDEE